MNKKIIALVIVVIILILGGVLLAVINSNRNNQNEQQNNVSNNNNENIVENVMEDTNENNTTTSGKILVLYFSQSGNTEKIANFIHEEVGGDILKLETTTSYPGNYDELTNYAQQEQRNDSRPELKTKIENMDEYDIIFLGCPIWWADMPMAIYTFLDTYDLSEKTIAPFITHAGSGLSGTPNNIKKEEPNATVTEGLAVTGTSTENAKDTVQNWLSNIGIKK